MKQYSGTEESRLRQTLNFVEGNIEAAKPPIAKPAAYFRDALKRGYGLATTTAPLLERKVVPTKAKGKPTGEQKLLASLAEAWWSEQRRTRLEKPLTIWILPNRLTSWLCSRTVRHCR